MKKAKPKYRPDWWAIEGGAYNAQEEVWSGLPTSSEGLEAKAIDFYNSGGLRTGKAGRRNHVEIGRCIPCSELRNAPDILNHNVHLYTLDVRRPSRPLWPLITRLWPFPALYQPPQNSHMARPFMRPRGLSERL